METPHQCFCSDGSSVHRFKIDLSKLTFQETDIGFFLRAFFRKNCKAPFRLFTTVVRPKVSSSGCAPPSPLKCLETLQTHSSHPASMSCLPACLLTDIHRPSISKFVMKPGSKMTFPLTSTTADTHHPGPRTHLCLPQATWSRISGSRWTCCAAPRTTRSSAVCGTGSRMHWRRSALTSSWRCRRVCSNRCGQTCATSFFVVVVVSISNGCAQTGAGKPAQPGSLLLLFRFRMGHSPCH